MKIKLTLALLVLITISCSSVKTIQKKTTQFHTKFVPIDPIEYGLTIPYVENNEVKDKKTLLASENEKMNILKIQGTLVSIVENTFNGDISHGPTKLSSKNTNYKVVMDYAKYKHHYTPFGEAKIGIGLRIVANIFTSKNNINLGDLFALGLAAKANHLNGTMSVEIIGMDSKDITNILPFQSEINKTTIQNTMQALAAIKAKIHDSSTRITPHILSIKPRTTLNAEGEITYADYKKQFEKSKDLIISKLGYK